jgi:hypothetical protein
MKPKLELVVFAVSFGVLGLVALVIGVHDFTISNASLSVSLPSLLLVAFGIALVLAAVHLALLAGRHSSSSQTPLQCKSIVLVACLITVVLGVYVFLLAVGSPGAQRPVVVIVSLLLVAVGVAGVRILGADAGLRVPRLQTALLLTLAGMAIGLSEFWYQTQYAPSHLGRAVSLSAALTLDGTRDGYDIVRAKLGYEDIGGRDVTVVGSTYSLTGSRVVVCDRGPTPEKLREFFAKFNVDPQRSHFMTNAWEVLPPTVLVAGKFVGDGKRLDANVPSTRQLVFFVPHGSYELLRLRAQLFAISASVPLSRSALPDYLNIPGDHDEYGVWRIDDYSWLHSLIYGRRRWVALRYELAVVPRNPHVSPDLRVTARFLPPTWSEALPSARNLQAAFSQSEPVDSSEPFADDELALAPPARPTAADRCPAR